MELKTKVAVHLGNIQMLQQFLCKSIKHFTLNKAPQGMP